MDNGLYAPEAVMGCNLLGLTLLPAPCTEGIRRTA
jgi:hypothetical protein